MTMAGKVGTPKRAVRSNHACRLCRTRKVKCDSVHPICGLCRTENAQCVYEQDRRQTSRVSHVVIQRLTEKLAEVEETVHRLEHSLSQRPTGQIQTPPDTAISILSPTHATSQSIDDVLMPPIPNDSEESIFIEASPSDQSLDDKQTTPAEIHTGVENDGGHISVYGPSSTFNPPLSSAVYRQPHPASLGFSFPHSAAGLSQSDIEDTTEEQCRLFANSAFQIQKEWTYMTERRFDLDGLDFDTAWHLLQIHWNHHHQAYLMTYRPAIMHSLATNGPYINKLLLNAIYLSSALNSNRDELHDGPRDQQSLSTKFFSRIQELTLSELENSSVASAVAFLIIGSSLVSVGRQTAGWHYSGLGYRMIIDLGLHIDPHKLRISHSDPSQPVRSFTEVDLELHRRVYWGAYINDKFQALYFGRPPTLTAIGIEPSRVYLDNFEELELWKPYVDPRSSVSSSSTFQPQPAYSLSTFQTFIYLTDIMTDVVSSLYSPQVQCLSQERILEIGRDLQERLETWMSNLPDHLRWEPSQGNAPPAHRFNPPMTFHMLLILLHRPFLPEGHLRHLGGADENMHREICLSSAFQNMHREICLSSAFQIYELAKLYRDTFTLRKATYMFSYCLFCAASIMPFGPSGSVDHSQRHIAGWFWIALRELQKGANFGLRRPIMIIRSLIEHAGLDLNSILAQAGSTSASALEAGTPSTRTNGGHHSHFLGAIDASAASLSQGSNLDTQVPELDDSDFERLCRDLLSGDIDGLAAPHGIDDDDNSLLYGLFRQT